jgi:anti-sigma B factor antagonist
VTVRVSSRLVNGVTLVELEGEINSVTSTALQDRIMPLVADNGRVLIDLSAVPYISSAGLRTLLLVHRRALSAQSRITLVGLSDEVRFVMSATGFLDFFVIGDNAATELARTET